MLNDCCIVIQHQCTHTGMYTIGPSYLWALHCLSNFSLHTHPQESVLNGRLEPCGFVEVVYSVHVRTCVYTCTCTCSTYTLVYFRVVTYALHTLIQHCQKYTVYVYMFMCVYSTLYTVQGFTAELGASGSFCPRHITYPVTAAFFNLSDSGTSPYLVRVITPHTQCTYHISHDH